MRELRVEDALLYLDQVKLEFGDRPQIYNEFLDIMKHFKAQQLDTPGVIQRVSTLFAGNRKLVLGFNTFLPEGYKIELDERGNTMMVSGGTASAVAVHPVGPPPPVAPAPMAKPVATGFRQLPVPTPTASSATASGGEFVRKESSNNIAAPSRLPVVQQRQQPQPKPPPQVKQPLPHPVKSTPPAAQAQAPASAPVEFDHAINYVTNIKKRFAARPEIYKAFLEILHTYQKEQRGIEQVLEDVSMLFGDHPDLLREFCYFLPDGVQQQARQQLEEVVRMREASLQQTKGKRQTVAASTVFHPQSSYPPQPQIAYTPQEPAPIPEAYAGPHGRTEEMEQSIADSVNYGVVSFAPARPPKKDQESMRQLAISRGRPRSVPAMLAESNVAELSFFEKAKEHLLRKELSPPEKYGSSFPKKHTPHQEFLKCLHLFGAGIIDKDELLLMLRGLFMQGHAPRTGINAGGGAADPQIAANAVELIKEFEKLLLERGPYADQCRKENDTKYNSMSSRYFDYSKCEHPTPSYYEFPRDYPHNEFDIHSGRTDLDTSVLNDEYVCRVRGSIEDYDGIRQRGNVFENAMTKMEDERFEVDLAIDRNKSTISRLEALADEANQLLKSEADAKQPMGRLKYKLKSKEDIVLKANHIGAIARAFGDNGDEILQHLVASPITVLPVIFKRMCERDCEWSEMKEKDFEPRWKKTAVDNLEGSLDVLCSSFKNDLLNYFCDVELVKECVGVYDIAQVDKRCKGAKQIAPDALLHDTDKTAMFQPLLRSKVITEQTPHHLAYDFISSRLCLEERFGMNEYISRVWVEFVMPWFRLPVSVFGKELHLRNVCDDGATKNKIFPGCENFIGSIIVTAYGEGELLSVRTKESTTFFEVKLPYGTAILEPHSVAHFKASSNPYLRHGEINISNSNDTELSDEITVLFATDQIYLFMRYYCSLVEILSILTNSLVSNSSFDSRSFCEAIALLRSRCIEEDYDDIAFEKQCRQISSKHCHLLCIIPHLVLSCSEKMKLIASEQSLMLFDSLRVRPVNPVKIRSFCQEVCKDAQDQFRLQFDSNTDQIYFSFLSRDEDLHLEYKGLMKRRPIDESQNNQSVKRKSNSMDVVSSEDEGNRYDELSGNSSDRISDRLHSTKVNPTEALSFRAIRDGYNTNDDEDDDDSLDESSEIIASTPCENGDGEPRLKRVKIKGPSLG